MWRPVIGSFVNDELQRKWKEAAMAFNILSQHLLGGIQKNHGVTSVMAAFL
jgi:hypothetical protein